ncbi:hypothetical protein O6P43_003084 [Quillaja saponaria]|uniref:Uncharacterized protein n=1 Tax=Quillaja saponaria TaxID=32244 RepID=A0AAD7VL71_QUISA|nr:hypothetical protein O6P43_003084 [Quillaja saponaria]
MNWDWMLIQDRSLPESDVKVDLLKWGYEESYTHWVCLGETDPSSDDDELDEEESHEIQAHDDDTRELIDALSVIGNLGNTSSKVVEGMIGEGLKEPNEKGQDAMKRLYPGYRRKIKGVL